MYSYTHDSKTGGLLLNSSPTKISKEPRPVYAQELDLLSFNQYWEYEKQTDAPYMWAEANRYWYRGRVVASLKGGNVYNAPEIQLAYICSEWRETPNGKVIEKTTFENPNLGETFTDKKGNVFTLDLPEKNGIKLRPVDIAAMVEANREILEIIEATTVKKILAIYEKYTNKLDIFHVAFSGGKDSQVLLDLCKKTLPKESFVVVFGDTMMEFPDTYDVIDKVDEECRRDGIKFYRAYSHLKPEESWELFGPPSRTQRWCCSVHKSTPQAIKMREITQKSDNKVLAFVGVRAEESLARSKYDDFNYGKKVKGQYDHYPILDWTSAEIWLYIFANFITVNNAYRLGNSRVGCMVCPMSAQKSEYMSYSSYPVHAQKFIDLIRKTSDKVFTDEKFKEFMENGAWKTRSDGRYFTTIENEYSEETDKGITKLTLVNPKTDWTEWIKTIGEITNDKNIYTLVSNGVSYSFTATKTKNGYVISFNENEFANNPVLRKYFKNIFRKSTYCIGCKVCTNQCRYGYICMSDSNVEISHKCIHCNECNKLDNGCLRANSLKMPKGGYKVGNQSINCYSTHAPKKEWIDTFFNQKEDYKNSHGLGTEQIIRFTKFLRHAGLLAEKDFVLTDLFYTLEPLKDSDEFWAVLLVNLAHTPEIGWYVKHVDINNTISRDDLENRLCAFEQSKTARGFIARSFGRILDLPFGYNLGLGDYTVKGKNIVSFSRHHWQNPDPRVILYGLYVYNEKANAHYEFRLNSLYEKLEQDGIPPTCIFGLERQTMEPLLRGLSANYNEFINYSDTNDLCKISLREDKTLQDVLDLFKGVN